MVECVDEELKRLIEERKAIERTIEEMHNVLKEQNVGMEDSLVDAEDFPRSDIDIYKVRNARRTIIMSENDCKKLSRRIESLIERKFSNCDESMECSSLNNVEKYRIKMAVIKEVQKGSPVDLSGLQNGDVIVEFGDVTQENFNSLQDISKVVKSNEGFYIKVVVVRNGQVKRVNLKPRKWSGNGILGCFLEAVKN